MSPRRFPLLHHAVCLFVLAGALPSAHADIFKCKDETGRLTYSNVQQKGCQRLIASPVAPSAGSGERDKPAAKSGGSRPSHPASADFPKVDGATQKSRDDGRRKILDDELSAEQRLLNDAKRGLNELELVPPKDRAGLERMQSFRNKIALHERNIEAIRKELNNLK